jgi:hypothetical protein
MEPVKKGGIKKCQIQPRNGASVNLDHPGRTARHKHHRAIIQTVHAVGPFGNGHDHGNDRQKNCAASQAEVPASNQIPERRDPRNADVFHTEPEDGSGQRDLRHLLRVSEAVKSLGSSKKPRRTSPGPTSLIVMSGADA